MLPDVYDRYPVGHYEIQEAELDVPLAWFSKSLLIHNIKAHYQEKEEENSKVCVNKSSLSENQDIF